MRVSEGHRTILDEKSLVSELRAWSVPTGRDLVCGLVNRLARLRRLVVLDSFIEA